MNAFSVRGIREGRKTQTRRVVKFRAPEDGCPQCHGDGYEYVDPGNERPCSACCWPEPRYQVGDVLWVRETWAAERRLDGYRPSMCTGWIWYPADNEVLDRYLEAEPRTIGICGKTRPSIFMPQRLARLWLKVTDVRAERLQDIREEDIKAEGVQIKCSPAGAPLVRLTGKYPPCDYLPSPRPNGVFDLSELFQAEWASLWDGINGKKYPWESNPWVRAYTFEWEGGDAVE